MCKGFLITSVMLSIDDALGVKAEIDHAEKEKLFLLVGSMTEGREHSTGTIGMK